MWKRARANGQEHRHHNIYAKRTQHLQAARESQFTIHGQPEPETKKQRDILYRQGNSIAHIQFVVTNYARLY